jgi:hypothetical protein
MPAQPSNEWSVQLLNADGSNSGQPQTLAALGIEDFSVDENNQAADVGTFVVGGRALDAAQLWPFGQLLAVLDPNGVRRFFGRVEPWSRAGTPDAQNHTGRIVNPWWYLAAKIYEQRYLITSFATVPAVGQPLPPSVTTLYTSPRVVLNILYDGAKGFYSASTGQQIADAVNWAISQGAPIRLGTVDPSTTPFSDFQKGIFCADVIKLMFRKEPDFLVDWDYTTVPFPTIHFRKQASLAPLVIDLTTTTIREQVTIKERPDWQRSYVKINYDQTQSTSSGQYLGTAVDLYPNPIPAGTEAKFRGVDLFADLTGFAGTATSQTASFASVPFDITDVNTWIGWKPSLAAGTIASVSILLAGDPARPNPTILPVNELDANGNAVAYDGTCAYEVVDGEWCDWIPNVNSQRVRATAWAKITNKNGSVRYEQLTKEMTAVSYNTSGISKTFSTGATNVSQYAEPIPQGLAKAMWTSWQNLAIEGNFTNVEAVVGSSQNVTRSNSLNFLTTTPGVNGKPDWRAVNALVQRRTWNIRTGTTRIEFGAPLKITGHELIDAVRATRYRVTTIDLGYLFGGALGGGSSNVRFGRKTHARHTQHGATHNEVSVISKAVTPVPGTDPVVTHDGTTGVSSWQPPTYAGVTIALDPSKAKGSDGNWHPLAVQEQKVCVKIGGVFKQRTLLALTSAVYQAPDDPA